MELISIFEAGDFFSKITKPGMRVRFCKLNDFIFYVYTGDFSRLRGNFTIIRDVSETVVRIFAPSVLVIIMSIIGFWIDNEDAIDRITLSVTTILTITTMNEGVRKGIPKVKIECLSIYFGWVLGEGVLPAFFFF